MKRLKTPLHLVSSGEYNEENHSFYLDKPLEQYKTYLVFIESESLAAEKMAILATLSPRIDFAFETTSIYTNGNELSGVLEYTFEHPLYLFDNRELFDGEDAVVHIYELDI